MIGLLHYIRTSLLLRGAFVALLLGCVGIGVFGEWLVFKIIQSDIHQAIENRIAASDFEKGLVTIKIATKNIPDNFTWVEAHEFRYKGEMYDIVKQEVRNDTTYYTCIHDVRETALYANMEQQIQDEFSTNPERQKQQTDLLQKIPKFYFIVTNSTFLNYTSPTQPPAANKTPWLDISPAISSPPPRL